MYLLLLNHRTNIASSINLDLSRLKNWGSHNLVSFKTQCCLISRRVDRNLPDISFDSSSLEFRDKISMLGVTLGSDLSWNDHIIAAAKATACNFGFLFRTKRFFTPTQLLTLYKAQIRPCLEYCSHLWRGASKHSLNTLDAIQRRAIRLLGDPASTDTLDPLAHRRSVSALSLFYRYYLLFLRDKINNPSKDFICPKYTIF